MPSGPWSASDLARAVAMRNEGATPDAIAAIVRRSASSVVGRLHRARAEGHAVPLDRVLTPWTRERADRACAMWGAGAHVDDIAHELGTTPKAARAYVERAKRERPYMERPGVQRKRRWTSERVAAFAAMWNAEATLEDMSARTGLRPHGVKLRAVELRRRGVELTRRKPGRPAKSPHAPHQSTHPRDKNGRCDP